MTLHITSLQNPRIMEAQRLRNRRQRDRSGRMLIEGFAELRLAWQAGLRPEEVFVCVELLGAGEAELRADFENGGVRVAEVTPAVMEKLAYREHPDAWLAVAPIPAAGLERLELPAQPLVVIAEGVEKPGNLGAILRSADAAGVDGVIVCDPGTDPWNPNVVRASKGTLFQVPLAVADSRAALDWLKARDVTLVAATPAATRAHWELALAGRGVALVVGAEDRGLSPFWLEHCDEQALIPMWGRVNSLNVAQALTLLVYEARRQRRPSPR